MVSAARRMKITSPCFSTTLSNQFMGFPSWVDGFRLPSDWSVFFVQCPNNAIVVIVEPIPLVSVALARGVNITLGPMRDADVVGCVGVDNLRTILWRLVHRQPLHSFSSFSTSQRPNKTPSMTQAKAMIDAIIVSSPLP